MRLESTEKLPKTKEFLLSSLILFALVLLICAGTCQGQISETIETDQLDPTYILFGKTLIENIQKEEDLTCRDDNLTVPDIELKVCESPNTIPQSLLHDEKSFFFSTMNLQGLVKQKHEESVQPDPNTAQTEHVAFKKPPSTPKDDLLKTSISSVTADSDSPNKQMLGRLIEQISSVKLHPKPKKNQSQSQQQDESKEPAGNTKETTETAKIEPPPAQENPQQQSTQTLNPEIVKRLEQIIEQSGTTNEPQLLADMLYQTGHYELAAYFYELAIGSDPGDTDKAWLMMQKAVCLCDGSPAQALQIYKNLVSQYPASLWVELAKNRQDLIGWLETQQPKKLIEQCRQDLKIN